VSTPADRAYARRELQRMGLTRRAWNVLWRMGVVTQDDVGTLTRAALVRRLEPLEWVEFYRQKDCGILTLHVFASLLGRPHPMPERYAAIAKRAARK
jgi:hypothetical protein